MKNRTVNLIADIVLLLLSAVLFVGLLTFFAPCAAKEDGSYMACHWAGNAAAGVAAVLTVISLVNLIIRKTDIKKGLLISIIPVSTLGVFIHNGLIKTCMMESMQCNAVTKPACTFISAVILIISAVYLVYIVVKDKKGKKEEKKK